MIFRLVSAESNILPPGPVRQFGGADPYKVDIRWASKSSSIPKRKDKVPKKKEVEVEATQEVVIPVAPVSGSEPETEPEPEPRRAPPAPMSRQAMGKAMKAARKNAPGKTARPMMRSSATTAVKRRVQTKAKRAPKLEQPPFVLDDAALRDAARKALNGFSQRQRKVFHAIDVMAVMRDPRASLVEYDSILIAYAVGVLEEEVAESCKMGTMVDRRFLHAKSSRAFGRLIKKAFERLQAAVSYNDSQIRGRWVRRFEGEGMEIFFLIDSKDRPHMIHAAMGQQRFKQWIKGWSCCEPNPADKPKKRPRS